MLRIPRINEENNQKITFSEILIKQIGCKVGCGLLRYDIKSALFELFYFKKF
ncbi:hypothetical protein BPIT_31150 [Candidatus Brocadia pituitae]|nr:hypothetical protein BPIT_31150 [Candidatus Brocadia pituitae]